MYDANHTLYPRHMAVPYRFIIHLIISLIALCASPAPAADAPNPLEILFSRRAGQELRLYGRDLFTTGAGEAGQPAPVGAIADDYRLGPGDELVLHLRGQVSRSARHLIGQDGLLTVEDLRPLQATGRTLGELRRDVEEAVSAAHLQTQTYLSVGRTRMIGVLVLGAVARPGRQQLNAFATPLDALLAAGGVGPQGSLRAIRLIRPGQPPETLDLYQLLDQGDGPATSVLGDGARLVVPPLGPSVAIAGAVKRPGIYELPDRDGMAGDQLLALAGGPLRPGGERTVLLRYGRDGVEKADAVDGLPMLALRDGDLLLHAPDGGTRQDSVALAGHVETPGARPLSPTGALADLIDRDALPPDLYQPLAVLLRQTRAGGPPDMRPVNLVELLAGRDRQVAQDGDELMLLGADDIAFLRSHAVLSRFHPNHFPAPTTDCPGLDSLTAALTADPAGALAAGPLALAAQGMLGPELPCPPLFVDRPDLLPFLLRQSAFIRRGALRPGPYPVVAGVKLALIAPLAGARLAETDEQRLVPGQLIDIGGDGVLLAGAVRQPGLRPLEMADSLSHLLGDGSILQPDAYGLAAILDRFDSGRIAAQIVLFAPGDVLAGGFDLRLRDGDRITILSRSQMRAAFPSTEQVIIPVPEQDQRSETPPAMSPAMSPAIRAMLADRMIGVRGGVREPGDYPVAGPLALPLLLRAAGGLREEADRARVELIPALGVETAPVLLSGGVGANRPIQPGEAVRVGLQRRPAEPRSIMVAGEVMEPGSFDLAPGETLSSLLVRTGGLSPHAYPAGAIFTRETARAAEEDGLRRTAREMDRQLAQLLGGKNPPDPQRVALARQLADELRSSTALGRITVQVDPEILASRPELDIPLQAGDRLYIPKRPATVTVAGEVLSPASLLFDPEKDAEDYLREAGGLTRFADDDRIFLIHPDGSAEPLDRPRARHGRVAVTPGAMLVVPRDAEPLEILPLAQSITTILSQIAFSAAAIASINN